VVRCRLAFIELDVGQRDVRRTISFSDCEEMLKESFRCDEFCLEPIDGRPSKSQVKLLRSNTDHSPYNNCDACDMATSFASPLARTSLWNDHQVAGLLATLNDLRADLLQLEEEFETQLDHIEPTQHASARNLLHYVGLRRKDLRGLQDELARLGLSSLGRAEAQVMANVDAVLAVLRHFSGRTAAINDVAADYLDFDASHALVAERTEALLGPVPSNRQVRIMVTMPPDAATDADLVHRLLAAGMDCMRINCAHDDDAAWEGMVSNLRRAQQRLQRPCKILMDLVGPKIRTGPVEPGPAIVKWRPSRDVFGRVTAPARIWVTSNHSGNHLPNTADAVLPIVGEWAAKLRSGDRIRFVDARDRKRVLTVVAKGNGGCWAEALQTAYVVPGLELHFEPADRTRDLTGTARVGTLPPLEKPLVLQTGDKLLLFGGQRAGTATLRDADGRLTCPAIIGCTAPEIFRDLRPGERILLDDGKIAGVIRAVDDDDVEIEITRARSGGSKLRGDKGINLPDSTLQLPSLTPKDIKDLEFIVRHSDLVNYSWVRQAADIEALQSELTRLDGTHLGIVLKIETQHAFNHFPGLLLAAMKSPTVGVMIARGDLAVEVGYERLAEVQEELLWMCEAAHVPVVWATQVLESLAKDGLPSRAEITDAAMGVRAECVMLNKGPYAENAIRALDDILRRMEAHQSKKRSMLRKLQMAFGLSSS
jgi:pyruvate kinase